MRAELRSLAHSVLLWVLAICLPVAGLVATAMLAVQTARLESGDRPLEVWLLLLIGAVPVAGAAVVAVLVVREVSDRRAERMTEPLRRLTHRAEDFGMEGLALDVQTARPTDLQPQDGTIPEVDAIARILDRNHRSFQRALSAERSFAADASHQLRTPLAALLLRLEEISTATDVDTAREEAEIAITQTERLAGVVDDLLHRTRAGHADGGRSVSLDTVLSQLEQEWSVAFGDAGRRILITVERGTIVRASASAISQILNALVENALVHGGGTVRVSARRSGPSAVVRVTDEGPGIDPQLAATVFERAVSTGGGTGLGLAMAREAAESFGGRLDLVQTRPVVFALYVSMAPAG